MKSHIALIAGALASVCAASPALAAQPTERVPYHDLNLATPDGQAELQKRLDKATYRVCRFDEDGNLKTAQQEHACYREARQEAALRMAKAVSENRLGG
ncbi:UrcA family protein [Altericroceibacterium endophyticum]|uniref:UrcA family protein n=1 Tax=Altericroceibacterium endophyticum TaxID=1808508 RepID=A0A6I4T3Z1_9SPHN|nr:UrcA family protein [Altericroceibacterium endophyticum]MXO65627.1 UrcA family protein [Altericroceibacterium endophyticum]